MSNYQKAKEAMENGAYGEASEYWAIDGFQDFIESHFQPGRKTRIGITTMLRAVSCDIQAENEDRAKGFFDVIRPLIVEIPEATDDEVLAGLAHEWLGDGYLMLGEEAAIEHFQTALSYYEDNVSPIESWGFEEEFDYAYWALESFLDAHDYSLPQDAEFTFEKRIERKLEIANDYLSVDGDES